MMTYIIQRFGKYILDDGSSDVYSLTLSPMVATKFKSKKEAKYWIDNNTDDTSNTISIVRVTEELINEFKEWSKTMIKGTINKVDHSERFKYDSTVHNRMDILNFWYDKFENSGKMAYKDYASWPHLSSVFDHIFDICIDSRGEFYCSLYVNKKSSYDNFINDINIIRDKINNRSFTADIFDHYLCEGGNKVDLNINDDDTGSISGGYMFSRGFEGTLEECFEYLKKHRYYR